MFFVSVSGRGARGGLSRDEDDDAQAAERRRFMEKDLEMWEAESAKPETRWVIVHHLVSLTRVV